ncbi:MAG: PIN domain-containing protein [Candidatus Altiarchaeota archaeon]
MVLTILLDTNFLMTPVQNGIDVFAELPILIEEDSRLCVPKAVVRELEGLAKSNKADSPAARVALRLIESNNLVLLDSEGGADEWIKQYSLENRGKVLVCTNDRELRSFLCSNGVGVVSTRGKGRLTRF